MSALDPLQNAESDSPVRQNETTLARKATPGLSRTLRDNLVAVFGVAGAIAAIVAAWFAYVQITAANQQHNAQESASVSAQARLISAAFIPYHGSLTEGPNGQTITQIGLYNDSPTPREPRDRLARGEWPNGPRADEAVWRREGPVSV
jgi:hypothetical protein